VLAGLPGEHHSLGLTAFGVVLQHLGWDIRFLGRDTPVAAVRTAADAVHADAIVLAAVMPESIAAAVDDLNVLMATHSVVVGGPAADRDACALPTRGRRRPVA
jgi:methanogenic corrinoid protein MtbC1